MGKNLLINGADFSQFALPNKVIMSSGLVVGATGQKGTLRGQVYLRSTLLTTYPGGGNTLWGNDPIYDEPTKSSYALNKIPFGATSIKVTYANIVISICIFDANYYALFTPSWSDSTGVQTINLSSMQNGRYFSVNIQSENATLDNVNVEFTF